MNDRDALLALNNIPLLGPVRIRTLVQRFGSPAAILTQSAKSLQMVSGLGPKLADSISQWREMSQWQRDLQLVEEFDATIVTYLDPTYPKPLRKLHGAPVLLYVWGQVKALSQPSIAVVGTRNPTHYGRDMAEAFGRDLGGMGYTVVSGLARGVDAAAHQGAVKHGACSIAVIGSGLASIYPRENVLLAEAMTKQGAVISEFPMATPPEKQNFPQRNRIVAGMCQGTVLIEAPEKSGAMLTMRRAESQNRRLFALPGRVDVESFRGNHLLIKQGRAQLVEGARDVAEAFDDLFTATPAAKTPYLPKLSPEETRFLSKMPSEELHVDSIAQMTDLPITKLNVLLMGLVLKKVIKEYPGKIYKKVTA